VVYRAWSHGQERLLFFWFPIEIGKQ
jgi:hypothetical protein